MNITQIRDVALKSAATVKNSSLQMFKSMFKEFAPESWVITMDQIPLQTIQCMIKIGKRIALKVQNNMTTEPTPAQMTNKLKKNCKHGYPKVAAFEAAVNTTVQQLPQSVRDIGTQFSSQFKQLSQYLESGNFAAASPIGVKFLQSVANISIADRQQMGTLFPKFSKVFVDPRLNDLINMTILAISGSSNLMKNATNLAKDIFYGGLSKATNSTTNSTSSSQPKLMSPKDHIPQEPLYFDAPEAFDQPQQDQMTNGALKMLAVLKGNDSQDGMIEPIAHDDAKISVRTLPDNELVELPQEVVKTNEEVSFLPKPPAITD
uniref:Uncharacterized protein n=1 Tax=Ditylenchus dipsaci TaxID=166011 RepID=A0A915CXE5_9BILA